MRDLVQNNIYVGLLLLTPFRITQHGVRLKYCWIIKFKIYIQMEFLSNIDYNWNKVFKHIIIPTKSNDDEIPQIPEE